MTQRWQRREISNFEYLMFLNTISGNVVCIEFLMLYNFEISLLKLKVAEGTVIIYSLFLSHQLNRQILTCFLPYPDKISNR